mgnify:CR=1 FL=1
MKTPQLFGSLTLSAALALTPQICLSQSDEPTGQMSASTKLVQAGQKANLSWNVVYPDLPFDPPTGTTTEDVTIYVRVFGVALEGGSGEIPVSTRLKIGNRWHHIFAGKGADVNPGQVLLTKDVDKGTKIELGAEGSSWGERSSNGQHVTVLKNGDTPPSYAPAFDQGDVVSFLSGYIVNGKVSIGPKDVIYVAELYSESPGSYYYDMQDVVVHVRFEERTTYVPAD